MSRYFTETLSTLEPYTPGEQPKVDGLIKLNTNENPYPPAPGVAAAVAGQVERLRLYSDINVTALRTAIAQRSGLAMENVLCGNGSDENLMLAIRAFCDETHPLAFADITYGFYPVWCELFHIPKHILPLEADFTLDPARYYGLNETIVIANPNAPTGRWLPVREIEQVVRRNPDSVVIVDEAYVDFCDAENASCVPLVKRYDNLLVVQTFSKSRNLAGARLGFCFGAPGLIADLDRVKFSLNPYNVNLMSEAAGVAAIRDEDYFRQNLQKICASRAYTAAELEKLGFRVLPSQSNFLFAAHPDAAGGNLYAALRARNILVRHFTAPRIDNWLRITIGTQQQMQTLIAALQDILRGEETTRGK
ncbi:MAG: histidinol-phosphate transaminase [Gemmiger sp.]